SVAACGIRGCWPWAQYCWGGAVTKVHTVQGRTIAHDAGPSPLEYARRFYYDSMVFDRRALRYLVDLLGADRLLVGSDFPAMPREAPAGRSLRSLDLDPALLERITWHNAWSWLGTPPPR